MATLRARQFFELTGLTVLALPTPDIGDRSSFASFTVTGRDHRTRIVIADNFQEETIWATGQGGVATFVLGFVRSDQDIVLELRSTTPDFMLLDVRGSGVWHVFGGRMGGDSATLFPGDGVVIGAANFANVDRIVGKRNVADLLGDATVEVVLVL